MAVGGNFRHEAATNLILLNAAGGQPENWQPPLSVLTYPIKVLTAAAGKFYTHEKLSYARAVEIDSINQTRRPFGPIFGGDILSLAVHNNALFVGGNYYGIGSDGHGPIAAIDLQTEKLIPWDPLPPSIDPQEVTAIAADESGVFVAHNFARSSGLQPNFDGIVRAFSSTTLEQKWTNSLAYGILPATLSALTVQSNRLFVAGDFLYENNEPRRRVAALNTGTGALDSWTCHANAKVNAIATAGDRVAFAGKISSFGGVAREYAAAFNIATGAATDWNPRTEPYTLVTAIEVTQNAVFMAGTLRKINGQDRVFIGAVDRATGSTTLGANAQLPPMYGSLRIGARTMDQTANALYFGGYFTNSFGVEQRYIAAFELNALQFKSTFRPTFNDGITKILALGDTVYAEGPFTQVNDVSVANQVALNAETGAIVPWSFPFVLPAGVTLQNPLLPSEYALYLIQGSVIQSYDLTNGAKLSWEGQLPGTGYSLTETRDALIAASDAGLSYFPKIRAVSPSLESTIPTVFIAALPGENITIDASSDLINWTTILQTNATLKSFQGPALQQTENRFYRVLPTH